MRGLWFDLDIDEIWHLILGKDFTKLFPPHLGINWYLLSLGLTPCCITWVSLRVKQISLLYYPKWVEILLPKILFFCPIYIHTTKLFLWLYDRICFLTCMKFIVSNGIGRFSKEKLRRWKMACSQKGYTSDKLTSCPDVDKYLLFYLRS